ncbi:hypothetical protein SAPIO_CDS6577 [Scedosporium apiospermum]|uniref:Uncharacterized protein n=1 Tax=Pseudallescheria apiosperma TaxID=563466 RepID=A0A084G3H5_PSEDA|nr:uncharacterized protein SAPIO_CDS6577 [Scedosporium apiospermum]KEZ41887.1 hypothetical protein SAPIO_CDS6577 [Scedosporium apiospermum]
MDSKHPAHTFFVRPRLAPVRKLQDDYVSPEYLGANAIECLGLDFTSGTPLDPRTNKPERHAEPFTQLFPFKDMERAILANKPWVSGGWTYDLDGWDTALDNWWHAKKIVDLLSLYLYNHHEADEDIEACGIIDSTGWRQRGVPPEYRLNRQDDAVKWAVIHIWHRETHKPEPHVVCALADRVPLRDDQISVPELRTILTLSGVRALDEGRGNRKRIPVTVVSAAGRQLRIVVGIVDSKNGTIEIREGPIIDFSEGVKKNWKQWITTLCWISG